MNAVRSLVKRVLPCFDAVAALMLFPAAWALRVVRRVGLQRLPACRRMLDIVGMTPVRNHYYEPRVDPELLQRPLSEPRLLPGIDLDLAGQLAFLDGFHWEEELADVPREAREPLAFWMDNGSFESGDAEYFYQVLRATKPRRLFEIGSGHSTLMARRALDRNRREDSACTCEHVCVEPYEMPWLERTGARIVRTRVETLPRAFWRELQAGDLLFIDSSHVIRPQGDVLYEYLELLPSLSPGVLVHVHDIFTPRDYPESWVLQDRRMWNEQYLLEALLGAGSDWQVVGAVNHLRHACFDRLRAKCPFLTPDREPGSFYIRKVR